MSSSPGRRRRSSSGRPTSPGSRALGCDGYASLHRVSIEEPDRFWRAVARPRARPRDRVSTTRAGSSGRPGSRCTAERRPGLRARLGRAHAGRGRGRLPNRGRAARRVDVRRALRQVTRLAEALVARHRRRRPGRDLHADGARRRRRLPRVRAHRRRPGADLLRLRRPGRRPAPPGLGREGRDHGRLLAPPRDARADARDDRGGAARVASVEHVVEWSREDPELSSSGRASWRRSSRGGAPVPARVHVRHDRDGRRARCTCTAASSSRSRARRPTRRTSAPATAFSSPRTWAGSWGRGRWSAPARSAPP